MKNKSYINRSFTVSVCLHTLFFCGVFGAHRLFGAQSVIHSKSISMGFSDLNLQRTVRTPQKQEQPKLKSVHLVKPTVSTEKLVLKQKFERKNLAEKLNQQNTTAEENRSNSSARNASNNAAPNINSLIIKAPKPPYPWLARKAGFEGNVVIAVKLSQNGKVSKARVVKSSTREDCDQSALKTILNEWQFVELSKAGLSENEEIKLQIVYKLD